MRTILKVEQSNHTKVGNEVGMDSSDPFSYITVPISPSSSLLLQFPSCGFSRPNLFCLLFFILGCKHPEQNRDRFRPRRDIIREEAVAALPLHNP